MDDNLSYPITLDRKLGVVISLLLRLLPKEPNGITLREQVDILRGLGVRPKDIADILGKTRSYVTKEIASLNRSAANTRRSGE